MQVYKISYTILEWGKRVVWAENRVLAAIWVQDLLADEDVEFLKKPVVEIVNIPVNKQELVQWLNDNFNSDNG